MRRAAFAMAVCMPLTFAVSCATRQVGVRTGTLTLSPGQTATFAQDRSFPVWRKAVEERTRALVAAGHADLADVKRRVCEETATEESNARRNRMAWAQAAEEATLAEAAAEPSGIDPELLKRVGPSVVEAGRKAANEGFTETRDRLIEHCFREAMAEEARAKLDQITITTINAEDMPLVDIADFLTEASLQYDRAETGPKGLTFVVSDDLKGTHVTVIVRPNPEHVIDWDQGPDMSLAQYLNVVCSQNGLRYELEGHKVTFARAEPVR